MLHQTVFATKANGIFLECLLILPREWVLEFGRKVEGVFRLGPRSILVVYDGIFLKIPVLQENERSTGQKW